MPFMGIWKETDRAIIKGDKVIVGCGRKDQKNEVAPFCGGFAAVAIDTESVCPKCGCPLGAKRDGETGRWMGMIPVM